MSKDKSKKKDKSQPVAEPTLSKKERKALAKREAEIAAELERRAAEKKAAKKAKKAKGKKAPKVSPVESAAIEAAKAARAEKRAKKAKKSKRDEVIDPETGKTRPEVTAQRQAEKEKTAEKIDAEIAARLAIKKAARKEGKAAVMADAENVDRSDHDAVMAYNLRAVAVGATMLTSDQEREKVAARSAEENVLLPGDQGMHYHDLRVQAAEVVETDKGREFQVGESVNAPAADEFAKPSDAAPRLESGSRGYKIITLDKEGNPDPKVVRQYTRVTTYVGNIDDETSLKEWLLRLAAEGLASKADELLPRISDAVHRRDVTIAKAAKKDRKGSLGLGELGRITDAANAEAKKLLNAIVEEALDAAGRNDKADAGTHLHTLAEIVDAKGIDPIREMHEQTQLDQSPAHVVTENDLASMEAYDDAMRRMGAEHIVSEAVIVNDSMRYAGRLDAIKFAKLPAIVDPKSGEVIRPADQRRKRYVFDVKSGKIDLAAGKISRQLSAYTLGDLYDPETGARTPHGAAKDVAIVVHLPLGSGECHVHPVDLKEGQRLLKLSESVRAGRASGRKTINTAIDLAAPVAVVEPDESEED